MSLRTANRKNWSKVEDRYLIELMRGAEQPVDWEEVSTQLRAQGYVRNAKQIKSRWVNNLAPELTKDKWCKSDILRLFLAYDEKGNRWQEIAAGFAGRTDNCIKNQLFSSIRKGLRSIIKELGLETGYSYTTMINQIKPKILAEFLTQRLAVKESAEGEALRSINASDLIKSFLFKAKHIYQTDSIYERKEVMHAFVQILINMNNEYIRNKKISKFNKNEGGAATPPLNGPMSDEIRVDENGMGGCDGVNGLTVEQLLARFRQSLDVPCADVLSGSPERALAVKHELAQRFGAIAQVTQSLIDKLSDASAHTREDFDDVRQFFANMHFVDGEHSALTSSHNTHAYEPHVNEVSGMGVIAGAHPQLNVSRQSSETAQQIRKVDIPRPLTLQFK